MVKPNRVLFLGSKQLGLKVLRQMHELSPQTLLAALTIDDRGDARSVFDQFFSFCGQSGVRTHIAKNQSHAEQIISTMRPDLCIVVGWYWLISAKTLDYVPHGFIGIHNSLLPRYRGGSPLVWQMINSEPTVGFSLFSFTPGMDDGPIWAHGSVAVENDDFVGDVLRKLEEEVVKVFRETYPKILDGSVQPVTQDEGCDTYCAQRTPDDGNIDWAKHGVQVYNFIRAQSEPYPGAFTFYEGKKLIIWRAVLFDRPYLGTPGQIARIASSGVYVVCGCNTALVLREVEMESKRADASYFLKSVRTRLRSSVNLPMSCADSLY